MGEVSTQRDIPSRDGRFHSRPPQGDSGNDGRRRVPDQDLRPTPPPGNGGLPQGGHSPRERQPVRQSGSAARTHGGAEPPRTDGKRPVSDAMGRTATEADASGGGRGTLPDKTKNEKKKAGSDGGGKEKKFYFQRPGEISLLRKMLILVFGLLFALCVAPVFFHIAGIGVISSSLVMLAICLTAMFWHLIDRDWTWKRALVVSMAGILFAACVVAFSIVSGLMLKASLTAVPSDCPEYTVVVLGCKTHGDQPSWMLSDRLAKAYAILRENPAIKCVVTGGRGDDEQYTEAYVMKKYLVDRGISPDRIYTEELSGSTEENLLYTKSLIGLNGLSENIVIVTDRFHELRARMWAEKSGFSHIYSGCCETRFYLVTGYWFREMFGLARLYVFGI